MNTTKHLIILRILIIDWTITWQLVIEELSLFIFEQGTLTVLINGGMKVIQLI